MLDDQVPIQPVDDPILCSPYEEPTEHWLYDRESGVPSRNPGRRPASYWYKTERTGSSQYELLAEEERDDLPLVNALRADVRRWRESKWQGASRTTKRLLMHWWRSDLPRRLFFCQLEAVETVIYLRELLSRGRTPRWKPQIDTTDFGKLSEGRNPRPNEWRTSIAQHPRLIDTPFLGAQETFPRYACKMATGSGKTVVMAMLLAWAFCNRSAVPGDPRFPLRALVVCPNLTIRERLRVLLPGDPKNYYEEFDVVPSTLRPSLAKGKVMVTNWHKLSPEAEVVKVGSVPVSQLGPESPEAFARNRLGDLWDDEPLMVLNDEGHHAYRPASVNGQDSMFGDDDEERREATVWIEGLDRINAACGIEFCVDLSATPFYIQGSGHPEGSPFPWIVSDFGLVDAIESGITKVPRLPAADNTGRPDPKYFRLWQHITSNLTPADKLGSGRPKPEAVWREAEDAFYTLAGQWKKRLEQVQNATEGWDRTPPVLIIVCDNTDIAKYWHRRISGEEVVKVEDTGDPAGENGQRRRRKRTKVAPKYGDGLSAFPELQNQPGEQFTLRVDSKLLEAAEGGNPSATRSAAAEQLRQIVSTVGRLGEPGARVRCVVSVNMLSEGWDANNVTHILGLRAFHSQLLCEQVVGRGLRRMDYTPDPETGLLTVEEVDIFGVPFSLIPFKTLPPNGPPRPPGLMHDVRALPEREALEIRFPIVEGYLFRLERNRIKCDVASVERTVIDPALVPTAAFVQPQVGHKIGHPSLHGGFEFEKLDREVYYSSTHPQAIAFEIAREIVNLLVVAALESYAKRGMQASTAGREGTSAPVHGGRAALFPQVLSIVQAYLRDRVDLRGQHPCEIGLERYARQVTELLVAAIEPDETQGEPPLLPRLNRYRTTGTTADVHFKTVLPVVSTVASHLNYVACHTLTWEQAAALQLEDMAGEGIVECYARNYQLGFTIPYEVQGEERAYEPDFIVRVNDRYHVVLEIKGRPDEDENSKTQGARRWVEAVNNWGERGRWNFLVCRDPQRLRHELAALLESNEA